MTMSFRYFRNAPNGFVEATLDWDGPTASTYASRSRTPPLRPGEIWFGGQNEDGTGISMEVCLPAAAHHSFPTSKIYRQTSLENLEGI